MYIPQETTALHSQGCLQCTRCMVCFRTETVVIKYPKQMAEVRPRWQWVLPSAPPLKRTNWHYKLGTFYRVPQKFVPLISWTITFDQNFIFTWNFQKMFISLSSTCVHNFSNWQSLFVFLSYSVAVAASRGIQRVDPKMTHFELFYHLVRRVQFNPQTIFV